MRRLCVFVCVAVLILSSTSGAFDGDRKGFVVGGGLGFAPLGHWSVEGTVSFGSFGTLKASTGEDKAGLGLHIIIGYAWDEMNMIVYEGNVMGYDSDFFNQSIAQGFNGAAWYHYYGKMGKSLFTTVGLGAYVFDGENFDQNDPGGGMLLGGGYEFSSHWQLGAYIGFGKTSSGPIDFKQSHINLLISVVAF